MAKRIVLRPWLVIVFGYNKLRDIAQRANDRRYTLRKLGGPTAPQDNKATPGDRLRERAWIWLSGSPVPLAQEWAERWIYNNHASSIGTHNLSYREEWLEKTLKKIPKGRKILDAGAGELQYKKFCEHLDYTSQDFAQYDGSGDNKGLQTKTWDNSKLDIISDITSIPVEDNSFDVIMCIEVFEHIPRPIDAIKEFQRILKPGGRLIITTPFSSLVHFAPYYFYNGYSRYFYEKLLPEHGFKIQEIDLNGNYFEYLGQELRRLDEIASLYAPRAPKTNYLDHLTKHWLLRRLEKLSSRDKGSNELLVQGVHVVAVKESSK